MARKNIRSGNRRTDSYRDETRGQRPPNDRAPGHVPWSGRIVVGPHAKTALDKDGSIVELVTP